MGNTIPLAVGLGLSIRLKRTKNISCVFFGDGAVEEGVFFEAVNFAIIKKLPVLFICENNLYSVYSPLTVRQPENRIIHEMVKGLGINTFSGNGNDVSEVFEITQYAVEKIKKGKGPQFIEFSTYRWREHCGPNFDNDIGYRSEEEFESWKRKDPVKHCEENLLGELAADIDDYRIKTQKYVDDAFAFAGESPFPDISEVFEDIFSS